eukprot:gene4108-7394_t
MSLTEILKNKTKEYLNQHDYKNASFYAEKLLSTCESSVNEDFIEALHLLTNSYFQSGEYKRVFYLLTKTYSNVLKVDSDSFYLAAKCLEKTSQWDELLKFLGEEVSFNQKISNEKMNISGLTFLRAKAFDELNYKNKSILWYKNTLEKDHFHIESFEKLVLLLSNSDLINFLNSLDIQVDWLKHLYFSKMNQFDFQSDENKTNMNELENTFKMKKSLNVKTRNAEILFYEQKYHKAHEITNSILKQDPFFEDCLSIHLSCLVELDKKTDLYALSHTLVNNNPKSPQAWYAVGCYYFLIKKFAQAKKFFQKSTSLDEKYVPSHIGIGHSDANIDDADSAMSAYRTAYRLFPGSHVPALYIGMQYIRTNALNLAESNLKLSQAICSTDPILYNELGVICYKYNDFENAIKFFAHSIKISPKDDELLLSSWEPSYYNLGHCFKKIGEYEKAIEMYQLALELCPEEASIYTSIGVVYHLDCEYFKAIDYYHKALSISSEDGITTDLISKAVQHCYSYSKK